MNKLMLTPLFVGLVLLGACVPGTDGSTPVEPATSSLCSSEDIVTSLTKIHDAAMPEITDEIDALNSRIDRIDEKMDALEEIRSDIDREIFYHNRDMQQEVAPPSSRYVWYVEYTEEDCAFFDNEYYEMVEFDLQWQWLDEAEKWEIYSQKVQVRDKEASHTYKYRLLDTAAGSLDGAKQRLVNERNDKSNAKEKSIQMLNDALANKDVWEIEEVSEKVYLVNGYGLGYGEQLAMGSWYYYEDTASLEPIDSASMRLRDILTASNE